MSNFVLIRSGIDPQPFLEEIEQFPDVWKMSESRQKKVAVQRESQSFPLRGLVSSKIAGRKRRHVHESRYTARAASFPRVITFVEEFARSIDADPGRIRLVNLPPGNKVYPHVDRGEYYAIRDRYHLILSTGPDGSFMKSGDEENRMQAGELWWFDNNQPHEAFNDSDCNRLHLIFDLLPRSKRELLEGDPLQLKPGKILDQVVARDSWTPA
jgi:aspartyl/asparaginyl beta-hydroxylase (cupin superfamily)